MTPPIGISKSAQMSGYLLRSRSHHRSLRRPDRRRNPLAFLTHPGSQPLLDEPHDSRVGHPMLDELDQPLMTYRVEGKHDTLPTSSAFPSA
jgi:hypothetical protein